MTKVIILGEQEKNELDKKPIEFVKFLLDTCKFCDEIDSEMNPSNYENIELIAKGYTEDKLDLMFAYDDDRSDENTSVIFFGHFNDGVV